MNKNRIFVRATSAIVAILLVFAVLYWAPDAIMPHLFLLVAVVAWWEWLSIVPTDTSPAFLRVPIKNHPLFRALLLILGSFFIWHIFESAQMLWDPLLMLIIYVALFLLVLGAARFTVLKKTLPSPDFYLNHLLFLMGGALYIGLCFRYALDIYRFIGFFEPHRNILFFFLLVWGADVSGFFAGTWLGRHRISKLLSPSKTWEGLAGTLVVTGALFAILFRASQPLWMLIALGAAMGCFVFLGDILESAIKRGLGVKDLGRLMPGHGGILDRVDGFFFSAPFYFLLMYFEVIIS